VAAIEVSDLRRTYRTRTGLYRRKLKSVEALKGIAFEVETGELFGLLGPNGAGKTTTIKILTTLLLPSAGRARVLGYDPAVQPGEIRRRIGHVFGGDRGMYDRLSALDNLRYFADLYRVPMRKKRRRIEELLDQVGLKGRERERVETYSRGMRQRLHIARGLLHDPEILFLDEPTIGLDPIGARELRETIAGLKARGKTILLTTHYMYEADELCERIAVLAGGEIVAEGTPDDLKRRVADRTVIEVETFGIADEVLDRVRRLQVVASVGTEERGQAQIVLVQCAGGLELMQPLIRELDRTTIGQGGHARTDARGRVRGARPRSVIRAFCTGFWLHLKQFTRNAFDVTGSLLWPVVYASIAYYLLNAKHDPKLLLSSSLGAAVMLMWSVVIVGSSNALENQRWLGTLELLVGAPMPFAVTIASITVASGAVGVYSLGATLAWGRLVFGIPISIAHPLAFAVAIPASVLAIGMLGLVMAATFVLYRAAFHLGIGLQYPVWIASGLLVPLSVLPSFVGKIGWFLAPSWGFRALREAALGGTPWREIGMCLVVSTAYFVVGTICLRAFVHVARSRASLQLT